MDTSWQHTPWKVTNWPKGASDWWRGTCWVGRTKYSSCSDGHAPIQLFQAINSCLPGAARLRDGYLSFSFFLDSLAHVWTWTYLYEYCSLPTGWKGRRFVALSLSTKTKRTLAWSCGNNQQSAKSNRQTDRQTHDDNFERSQNQSGIRQKG